MDDYKDKYNINYNTDYSAEYDLFIKNMAKDDLVAVKDIQCGNLNSDLDTLQQNHQQQSYHRLLSHSSSFSGDSQFFTVIYPAMYNAAYQASLNDDYNQREARKGEINDDIFENQYPELTEQSCGQQNYFIKNHKDYSVSDELTCLQKYNYFQTNTYVDKRALAVGARIAKKGRANPPIITYINPTYVAPK